MIQRMSFSKRSRLIVVSAVLMLAIFAACDGTPTPQDGQSTPAQKEPSATASLTIAPSPTHTRTPSPTSTKKSPTATFTIDPHGRIDGIVITGFQTTGTPVPNAVVQILEIPPGAKATTDATGAFHLEGIDPDSYHLQASSVDGMGGNQNVDVTTGQVVHVVIAIQQVSIPMFLQVTSNITCQGQPAAGAKVWIAGTNQVFTADQSGKVTFIAPQDQSPILVDAGKCGGVLDKMQGDTWKIQLTQKYRPPILPTGAVIHQSTLNLYQLAPLLFPTPTPFPWMLKSQFLKQKVSPGLLVLNTPTP